MEAGAPPADVRIRMLGGFAILIDGEAVTGHWRLRKAKTLVKLLALEPGHRLHRDLVMHQLWPDADLAAATNNLHQAVHAARQVLGAQRIALRDDIVHLCPDDSITVDVEVFEVAAARARSSGDPEDLYAALESWTGDLLPEDEYAAWSTARRDRLADTHAAVAELRAERLVEAGEPAAALGLLEPLAAARPLDEALYRQLIAALSALGRKWDAIATYERLRDTLEEAFAAQPEAATRALYRRLLSGGGPVRSSIQHNLPEPATSFVGRRRQLDELMSSLDRSRLLTLTGPGGAGKSRLALELARRVAATASAPDGVWLVELAGVHQDDPVTSAVASVLGLTLPAGAPTTSSVAEQLAARAVLLLLDNCEHLLAASRDLVSELLARCPDVTVVTTSREPLALEGEVVHRVPSLEVPDEPDGAVDVADLAHLEAVTLFVDRARQIAPWFELDATNSANVAQICRRLDGMPLAVELAAARLAHLSVADIEGGLSTALTLLVRRGGPLDRQRTLAATLDWSHALLEPQEQVAFRRLAVFAGGFDLDAAAHVCFAAGPAVELVSRLVDKSLVEADTTGSTARYRLLEVVRQYAEDQLGRSGDRAESQRRHREWYAAGAATRDPDRADAVVGEPSSWFDVEQDNVRAAMSSALSEDPMLALQIAVSTWRFWLSRGLISDCARWLTLALERCPDRSVVRARAVAATAVLHVRQARGAELVAMGEEIVAVVGARGDPGERADAEHQRALLTFMAGDWTRADELDAEVLRGAGLPALVAASTQHLAGVIELSRGRSGGAQAWFDTAQRTLASAPSSGPPFFHAITLAWVVDDRTDPPLPYGEETFLLGRRVGALQAAGYVAVARALTERLSGRADSALTRLDDGLARFRALGDRYGEAYASAQRGHCMRWLGDQVEADRHLAIAEEIRRSLRDHRSVALAVSGRALVAAAAGDGDAARSRGREALQMMERSGDIPGVVLTSANLAVTEVLLGDPAAALRWLVRPLEHPDQPAGQRAHGWIRLLQAHLLDRLGERDAAVAAAAQARLGLSALGEQHGLDAVQRAFKDALPTVREDLAT